MSLAAMGLVAAAGAARAQGQPPSVCAAPDSIAVRGNVRVTEAALREQAGLVPGVTLSYPAVRRVITTLMETGQYDDVVIECAPAAGGGATILTVSVVERPLLASARIEGVERISAGSARDRVDLLVGRPVDPAQVARVVTRLDSLYAASGYYLARIRVDTAMVDGEAALTFSVDEGRRLAVSGVRIQGNDAVGARTIVSSMQTRPEGFLWWRKGEFDDDKFAVDLAERIPELYARRGFIDLQVLGDSLIVNEELGKAEVQVTLREGPRYRVGGFEVNGSRILSGEDIARFYPFGERRRGLGDVVRGLVRRDRDDGTFDQAAWDEATQAVQGAYSNRGYIFARVTPVAERTYLGPDSIPTVNLRWEVVEGSPAIINRVDILGNDITSESCIRDQLFVLPGDIYSQQNLVRSWQNIGNLGFFETPLPTPSQTPTDDGDIDIVFHVKEKKTGNVNFGASVGQGTGLGGFIGFDQPNLFGQCKRGSLQWQFGRYINDFSLSYSDPRIRGSRVSGMTTAYHNRSRFVIRDIGRSTRTGAQLRFGFPLLGSRLTRVYVDYGGERVSYGQEGLVGGIECNNCFRSTVGLSLENDTRTGMPFPWAGTRQSLGAQFNGGPLGGSSDFQRYTGEMQSYATLATFGENVMGSQPLFLTLGLSVRAGALFGNPGPFFVSQSFSLGGVQYGEQLRGYDEFSLTPGGFIVDADQQQAQRESFGNAFYTSSIELGLRLTQQMKIAAFYDVGNIWSRPRDFDPTRLYRGAGAGLSVVTPLGPLGLDLGYGFDRVDAAGRKDPKWQVHFKFGQVF
jgi:outer membrane protein insertion porin family